jgi:hypothetical protein
LEIEEIARNAPPVFNLRSEYRGKTGWRSDAQKIADPPMSRTGKIGQQLAIRTRCWKRTPHCLRALRADVVGELAKRNDLPIFWKGRLAITGAERVVCANRKAADRDERGDDAKHRRRFPQQDAYSARQLPRWSLV